jgi:hypothetical protein
MQLIILLLPVVSRRVKFMSKIQWRAPVQRLLATVILFRLSDSVIPSYSMEKKELRGVVYET